MSFITDIQIPRETLVVIGGIHAILKPDEVIKSGLFDLVCTGEGESTFGEILIKVETGEDISKISNTYFKDKTNGAVSINPRNNLISEETLWENNPDYSLFNEDYFKYPFDGKLYRRLSFETARGCPYDCTYCGNSALKAAYRGLGKFLRTRSVESIKQNLPRIIDEHHIELLYFADECFLSHPGAWLKELSDWYGREIKKPFIVQTRPENVTEEKIVLLKQMNAPFFQVSIGVESGSEKILFDVCDRRTKIDQIVESFDILHRHNVRTCAFFMIGFPYETREDVFKSIELCRRINPDVAIVSIFQPMPGQYLKEVCIKEGFIIGDEVLPTFTGNSILKMPQMSSEEIVNLRRVFVLYAMLPKDHYSDIKKCEIAYESNKDLYDKLINLRWYASKSCGDLT